MPNFLRHSQHDSVEIQVLLQAMKEDPPAEFKSKDKFLVQGIKIPDDLMALEGEELAARLGELWQQAETLKKTSPEAASEVLVEKKLKCLFLAPGESPEDGEPDEAEHRHERQTSRLSTGSDISRKLSVKQEFTDAELGPSPRNSMIGQSQQVLLPPYTAQPADAQPSALESIAPTARTSATPVATETSTQPITLQQPVSENPTDAALIKELQAAREKIKTLQAACEGYKVEIERLNVLRQRRGEGVVSASNGAVTGSAKQAAGPIAGMVSGHDGMSLQILAAVAVLAFLIGVLFF